ncbi:MAG TPA: hypothetical protein VN937_19520, partial [Blastocatellia bacterium]|nr:hypothetical protein [Blastocatellia bacterium]
MTLAHPSPQKLLEALPRSRERAIRADQLAEALKLTDLQAPSVASLLKEFVRVGLAAAKGGRYCRKPAHGLLIGTLRGTRSGHAFVVPDDPTERAKGDLFVNTRAMGSALNGDTVIARVTGMDKRGREGRVESVLHRANQTLIGKFVKLKAESIVSPIDERFLYDISIARSETL